jgi:3-deoxy-7-phosphoheptulonate synthase
MIRETPLFMELPSPLELKQEFPLKVPPPIDVAKRILEGKDERLALIVGPCSLHDPESALEYAARLKSLSSKNFFPIMRCFIEKPRTRLGWKGMLYDPHLDGSYDIEAGLRKSRALLLQMTEMGIPCAMELLDPLALPYFDDLITWGLVGARTSASQPHRQMASGLPFPVGFKNDCYGRIDAAMASIIASRIPHSHLAMNQQGKISARKTEGNPWTHLVLRGSDSEPNYDSVAEVLEELKNNSLEPRLVIDCSHGNCGKDPKKQKEVFRSILETKNRAIRGLMLESHLFAGKQPLSANLYYGVSITDPCLGWEETEELILSFS